MLDLVAFFPGRMDRDVLATLWDASPKSFKTNHLLVFVESGPEALGELLAKRARKEVLPAAFALQSLGVDDALPAVRAAYADAALAALDQGRFDQARALALEAEFLCKRLVKAGPSAELAWLDHRAAMYVRERAEAIASAEDVFRVIEGLRG